MVEISDRNDTPKETDDSFPTRKKLTSFSVHPEPQTRYGAVGIPYGRNDYAFASVLVLLGFSGLIFHPKRHRILRRVRKRQVVLVGAVVGAKLVVVWEYVERR